MPLGTLPANHCSPSGYIRQEPTANKHFRCFPLSFVSLYPSVSEVCVHTTLPLPIPTTTFLSSTPTQFQQCVRLGDLDKMPNNEMEKELKKQLTAELAKEKLQKYKLSCTRLEAKKGLEPLSTRDGYPVQNAIAFNQWEKQLVNWMKTVNVYWAVNPSTNDEKKVKHAKQYMKALETLYICLESAVLDPVAKAEVQDEDNEGNGEKALVRLREYFRKEKDEINLEAIEDDFRACKPTPGETIEAWLLRIRQFEVLLLNTERKKTDSEVLTIIKRNLPKEFNEFKLKYAMKERLLCASPEEMGTVSAVSRQVPGV